MTGHLGSRINWRTFKESNIGCFVLRSWQVAWPMTLIMFFEFIIGLTDVFVAGRVNKDVQAAYGFVMQVYFIFIVIANALTVGTVSIVSRLFSTNDRDKLSTAVYSSLVSATVSGVLFAVVGIMIAPTLIGHLNIPAQVKPYAVPLVQIYSAGLLFQYLLITTNGVLRSCDMIRQSLRTQSVVCLFNVVLNLVFVFLTPLGFRGIALATATAVTIGCVINLRIVIRLLTKVRVYSREVIKSVIKIGWPMGATQVLWQLGSMVLFLILSALPENKVEIIAAFTIGLRIESFIYMPAFAFNLANAVIVGNLLGEKKLDEAYRSGLITGLVGVSFVILLVVVVIANARWITSLLSNNPLVVKETIRYIYVALISEPFMAAGIILGGGLSGAGDTRSVMIRIAGSLWLVRLPLAYILVTVFGFGVLAVWWSMNISQFLQAILMYRHYSKKKWLAASAT